MASLYRWYSKFDNIDDENGIITKNEATFEFNDTFCGHYNNATQDSARDQARFWRGMQWGVRVTQVGAPESS